MAKFMCENCNYKFETNEEKAPVKCPYCEMEGSITKEQDAGEILDGTD